MPTACFLLICSRRWIRKKGKNRPSGNVGLKARVMSVSYQWPPVATASGGDISGAPMDTCGGPGRPGSGLFADDRAGAVRRQPGCEAVDGKTRDLTQVKAVVPIF